MTDGPRPNTARERFARAVGAWSMAHARLVIVLSLALTVLSAWAASRLDIVTDLKRLLPDDYPSVVRLDELSQRAGNQSDIVVTVSSQDPAANIRWGARFAKLMAQEEAIRFVQFRRDLSELEKKALLYLRVDQLEDIRQDVIERIRKEVRKDLAIGLDDEEDPDDASPSSVPVRDSVAAPVGSTERKLDDFEDDEDFGEAKPEGVVPGSAKPTVRPAAAELDDFEDDEDFASERGAAKPAAEGAAASADGAEAAEDTPLDIAELKKRYGVEDLPEYYTNDDGTLLVIRARPFAGTADTAVCRQLVEMARRNIERAGAPDDPKDLTVTLKGHHLERTEEAKSVQGNMATSALVSLGLLLLVVGFYFRRKRAVVLISTPLVMSVVWALGLAWVFYGYLNIISAFIFAVLLGLGIDFGIHVLARYDEARREGLDAEEAMLVSLETSGLSAATGALTTATVFFLLTVGDFQGFAQFGMVAGFGVVISLLVVFTVMPALAVITERRKPWRTLTHKQHAEGSRRLRRLSPRATLALAFMGLMVSVFGAVFATIHLPDIEFEYDFNKLGSSKKLAAKEAQREKRAEALRNGESVEDGEEYKDVIGRHSMGAPTIVMADTDAHAQEMFHQLDALLNLPESVKMAIHEAETPDGIRNAELIRALDVRPSDDPYRLRVERGFEQVDRLLKLYPLERLETMAERLTEVVSIYAFVPKDQAHKRAIAADIKRRLQQKRAVFPEKDRADIDELMTYLDPGEITVDTLPEWIRVQFREPDSGAEGRFLVLHTRGSKNDIRNTRRLKQAYFDLKSVDGTTIPSAATYFVLPEIMETIASEGPLIIGLALVGLFVILLVFFRRPGSVLIVLTPLVFSVLWAGGIFAATGFKLNFFNVVVVPLLLGMGIDHGVHIYSRYKEEGERNLARILRETGSAIWMATFTTMIGFAGLFFADNVGIHSMGTLAIVGMGLAFVGAVITLPAILYLMKAVREARAAKRSA